MLYSLAEWQQRLGSPARPGYAFDDGDPRGLERISIEQQKKRAKELLRALHANDPEAQARARRAGHVASVPPKLSDAQQVVAREHGFGKWSDFAAHVEHVRIARDAVAAGRHTAPDGRSRTLHVRCGWDISHALNVAGFTGDLLVFPDPYVLGPVPHTDSLEAFIRARVDYLAGGDASPREPIQELMACYDELERIKDYERAVLWFEHDSYDQLILVKLLDFLSDPAKRPRRLQLISVTHFPGVRRFNGLGQLPPEALRVLWDQFTDVTDAQLQLGRRAWDALRAPTPEPLAALIRTGTPELPTLAPALHRHLQELPAVGNGLSLTERLTLQVLAEHGPMNAARLFGTYNRHEPLPFWGDTLYWRVLFALAQGPQPALMVDRHGQQPKDWQVALTAFGTALHRGQADWLATHPAVRWVGGVGIDSRASRVWRYDPAHDRVLQGSPMPG